MTPELLEHFGAWVGPVLGAIGNAALLPLSALVLALVIGALVFRARPDGADNPFTAAGFRPDDYVLKSHRRELSRIVAEQSRREQQAAAEHQLALQALETERERLTRTLQAVPDAVREVGAALEAAEREYLQGRDRLRSERAREALRLATEKRIGELLQSLGVHEGSDLSFRIDADDGDPELTRNSPLSGSHG